MTYIPISGFSWTTTKTLTKHKIDFHKIHNKELFDQISFTKKL